MAFFFLCLFTFVMFFQPAFVFPALAPYRPYRYSAIIAIASFFLVGKKSDVPLLSIRNARYFFLFVAMQLISAAAIWIHGAIDLFVSTWLNLLIIYIIILKTCTDERKIKAVLLMIIAAISYLSYWSISNYVSNYYPGRRPLGFGWYENPNDLVMILNAVIPLILCFSELSTSTVARCSFLGVAALLAFNVLISASRNGLLGLTAVGCFSLLFMKKVKGFLRYSIMAVLIISVVTIGLASVLTRRDLVPGQLTGDSSSENRIVQWKACVRMTLHHPLFGVGPNEARFQARDYGGIRGLMPHNTLVQVFAETGILGGIFFVMCTIYPLWEAWKFFKIKENRSLVEPSIIIYKYLVIALAGFWICAFFSNRVYFKILYVLVALIIALRENILKRQVEVVSNG